MKFIAKGNLRMLNEWPENDVTGSLTFITNKGTSMIDYVLILIIMWYKYKSLNFLPSVKSDHFSLPKNSITILYG